MTTTVSTRKQAAWDRLDEYLRDSAPRERRQLTEDLKVAVWDLFDALTDPDLWADLEDLKALHGEVQRFMDTLCEMGDVA